MHHLARRRRRCRRHYQLPLGVKVTLTKNRWRHCACLAPYVQRQATQVHYINTYSHTLTHTHTPTNMQVCGVNRKNWSLTQGSCRRRRRLTVLLPYACLPALFRSTLSPLVLLAEREREHSQQQQQQQPAFFAIIFYIYWSAASFSLGKIMKPSCEKGSPSEKPNVVRIDVVVVDCVRHVSHMCCCLCRAGCVERIVHGHS